MMRSTTCCRASRCMRRIESGEIEIAPLAFMRGRTLANAFVILDEAQNTTPVQMKMFLTRLGENARMAVTGDLSQVDLPKGTRSGPHATRSTPSPASRAWRWWSSPTPMWCAIPWSRASSPPMTVATAAPRRAARKTMSKAMAARSAPIPRLDAVAWRSTSPCRCHAVAQGAGRCRAARRGWPRARRWRGAALRRRGGGRSCRCVLGDDRLVRDAQPALARHATRRPTCCPSPAASRRAGPRRCSSAMSCSPTRRWRARRQSRASRSPTTSPISSRTACCISLGFDHEDDAEARRMEALERRMLAELGVADPYREREGADG